MIEYAAIAEFSQFFGPIFRCHFAFFDALHNVVHKLGWDHVVTAHRRDRQGGIIRQFVFFAPDAQRIVDRMGRDAGFLAGRDDFRQNTCDNDRHPKVFGFDLL